MQGWPSGSPAANPRCWHRPDHGCSTKCRLCRWHRAVPTVNVYDAVFVIYVQQICHPEPLLGQESAVLLVTTPVFQIDGLVGNIDVAAQDEFAFSPEAHQMGMEPGQKTELGLLAQRPRGAAGKIGADDRQLARRRVETQFQIAALGIELGRAIAGHPVRRLGAGGGWGGKWGWRMDGWRAGVSKRSSR